MKKIDIQVFNTEYINTLIGIKFLTLPKHNENI